LIFTKVLSSLASIVKKTSSNCITCTVQRWLRKFLSIKSCRQKRIAVFSHVNSKRTIMILSLQVALAVMRSKSSMVTAIANPSSLASKSKTCQDLSVQSISRTMVICSLWLEVMASSDALTLLVLATVETNDNFQ
jgi:hypothetical protein